MRSSDRRGKSCACRAKSTLQNSRVHAVLTYLMDDGGGSVLPLILPRSQGYS
jgi:hypothetical protein